MNSVLLSEAYHQIHNFDALRTQLGTLETQVATTKDHLQRLNDESTLLNYALESLDAVKPLLASNTVQQVVELANNALHSVFRLSGEITYDAVNNRFVLTTDKAQMDLVDSNGGGLATLISFVFDLFLLLKSDARRLLVYDEAFTAVSDEYFESFITFVHDTCKRLDIDLLLVSHDARLDASMVDHVYRIADGKSTQLK